MAVITETWASSGGTITNNGGETVTARGVCWSLSANPTILDNKTTDGTGIGTFTSMLTGLTTNTTYYVRAYATNKAGTGYGNDVIFTTTATFTDSRDNHAYKVVTIGTQTWMAENLAWLPAVSPSSVGADADPYYYVYGYNGSTVSEAMATANYATYGVLYNWPAAMTACPSGWHLPADEEWKTLEMNLGMSQADADAIETRNSGAVGGKLKESGTTHWYGPNTGAVNTSGFTTLSGGLRNNLGFINLGYFSYFWSASEDGASLGWTRNLIFDNDGVGRYNANKRFSLSVRCLQGD
jgi:uncharacterized protein (TIGR02145 family)